MEEGGRLTRFSFSGRFSAPSRAGTSGDAGDSPWFKGHGFQGLCSGLRVYGLGFRVDGLGFRVEG